MVAVVLGVAQGHGEGEEEGVLLAVVQAVEEAHAETSALPVREALEQALREREAVGVSVVEGQRERVGRGGLGVEGRVVEGEPGGPDAD